MSGHRMPGGAYYRYRWQPFSDGWRVVEYDATSGENARIDYDMTQRVTTVTHGGGLTHRHEWNDRYLVEKYTDEAGQHWCYEWNENDLLSRTVDPSGAVREYHYDNAGNLTAETDPLGERYVPAGTKSGRCLHKSPGLTGARISIFMMSILGYAR
ncbi:hypothetical protein QWI28_14045 [Citrobacter freundii]|nr:hypothetical protein [Citrobacter freundii]